jgi:hypothetical protein
MTGSAVVSNTLSQLEDKRERGIFSSPYLMFKFSTRAEITKKSYERRIRHFLEPSTKRATRLYPAWLRSSQLGCGLAILNNYNYRYPSGPLFGFHDSITYPNTAGDFGPYDPPLF